MIRYIATKRVHKRGEVWEDGEELTEVANRYPRWRDRLLAKGSIKEIEEDPIEELGDLPDSWYEDEEEIDE